MMDQAAWTHKQIILQTRTHNQVYATSGEAERYGNLNNSITGRLPGKHKQDRLSGEIGSRSATWPNQFS
jgi:hypothetical protein